jgi:hypothetical protein
MTVTHVVGVDPGLVHTGVVNLVFKPEVKEILVLDRLVVGLNDTEVQKAVALVGTKPIIFIEGYKPRSNLNSDRRMQDGVTRIRQATGGKVLDNMGVKKVVKKSLMDLLGVWSFTTTTHHQDLRSAARIALLGMLKDDELNRLLADVVRDHLNGDDWRVV